MPHRKRVKHFHEPGHLHEFTFSCYQRRALLTDFRIREALSRSIDQANAELNIRLVAFVYMPEHVHLLTFPLDETPDLARIKQPFSKSAREILSSQNPALVQELTIRERPGKWCFRFWQEGPGYDRNLMWSGTTRHSIEYIHANPVRRMLCGRPIDWTWSSARYYQLEPPRQQFPELPVIQGMPE